MFSERNRQWAIGTTLVVAIWLVCVASVSAAPIDTAARDVRLEKRPLPIWIQGALKAAPEMVVARSEVTIRERGLGTAQAARFLPEFHALSLSGVSKRARGTVNAPLDTVDVNAYGPFTQVEVQFVQPCTVLTDAL